MNNPYFNLITTVWQYGKSCRHIIIGCYLAQIASQACLSLSPYVFGKFINVLQNFTPDKFNQLVFWLAAGVIVLLAFWGFHGPARIKERHLALKVQQTFLIDLYEKNTCLPLKWHQNHHSGDSISRITRAARALYKFSGDQFIYIQTIVKFLIAISFLLWISIPLGMLSVVTCIFAVGVVRAFDQKLIPLYDQQNEIDNNISAGFYDYISNMTTVLTLRLNKSTKENLYGRMLSIWPFFKREVILNEVKWFSIGLLLAVVQSLILIGYIWQTMHYSGTVMIGLVVMLYRYQSDLHDVFYSVSSLYSDLVHMDRDIKGVDPMLDDIKLLVNPLSETDHFDKWSEIKISNLFFCHEQNVVHKKIFNGINFSFKRGEKIALIGESGSGKSTLLNLLGGLYEVNSAKLVLDQQSFDTITPLKKITTLIPQDPEIFENTLLFNIAMDLKASNLEINKAVKLSLFEPVLSRLPNGLATDINEKGLNFSVGQKQRLALARGLFAARTSSLILMDEPTSSVDLATENLILSQVLKEFNQATMIVSLHRLHLLPKFDRIIMLDKGQIIADGSVTQLLNSCGPVRDLWSTYNNISTATLAEL